MLSLNTINLLGRIFTVNGYCPPTHRPYQQIDTVPRSPFDEPIGQVWDVGAGQELYRLDGHGEDAVYSVAWSGDGALLATGGADGRCAKPRFGIGAGS